VGRQFMEPIKARWRVHARTGILALTVLLCDTGVGTGTIAHSSLPRKDFSQPPSLSAFHFASRWQVLRAQVPVVGSYHVAGISDFIVSPAELLPPIQGLGGTSSKKPFGATPSDFSERAAPKGFRRLVVVAPPLTGILNFLPVI
jgi:hypothetical protein